MGTSKPSMRQLMDAFMERRNPNKGGEEGTSVAEVQQKTGEFGYPLTEYKMAITKTLKKLKRKNYCI